MYKNELEKLSEKNKKQSKNENSSEQSSSENKRDKKDEEIVDLDMLIEGLDHLLDELDK